LGGEGEGARGGGTSWFGREEAVGWQDVFIYAGVAVEMAVEGIRCALDAPESDLGREDSVDFVD
jgi:hypothetical protein